MKLAHPDWLSELDRRLWLMGIAARVVAVLVILTVAVGILA